MSYVAKTDWKNADIVMSIDMNRIEQGIKDNETSISLKANKDLSNIDEQIFKDKLNELGIADKAIKTYIVYSYLADEMETNLKFDNQSEYQQLKDGDYFICYFRHGGPDDITTEFTIENKRIVDDRGDIIPSQSAYVLNDMTALMQYKDNKFRIFGKHLKSIGSIGNTITLNTAEKRTLVGAINELYDHDGNRIITKKQLIPSLYSIKINKLYAIKINEPLSQINGVQIKKEGTNENYTLPANKVSMVYYNGTNFFVKANASGNAVPADVLAGKTFSNSNGTDLVGTAEIITPSQRAGITNALVNKGANVTSNSTWDEMKSAIENLQGNTFLANQVVPIRYGSSYHNSQNIQVTDIKPDKMYANAVDTNKLFGLPISYRCILNPVNGQIYVHNNYYLKVYDKDFNLQRNLNTGIRDCNYGFHFMQDSSKRVQVIMWGKEGVKYWDSSNPSSIYDFSLPTSLNDIVGMVNDPTGNFFMIIYKYSNKLACRIYQNLSNRWTKYTREDVYFIGSLNSAQQVKTLHMGFTNMVPRYESGDILLYVTGVMLVTTNAFKMEVDITGFTRINSSEFMFSFDGGTNLYRRRVNFTTHSYSQFFYSVGSSSPSPNYNSIVLLLPKNIPLTNRSTPIPFDYQQLNYINILGTVEGRKIQSYGNDIDDASIQEHQGNPSFYSNIFHSSKGAYYRGMMIDVHQSTAIGVITNRMRPVSIPFKFKIDGYSIGNCIFIGHTIDAMYFLGKNGTLYRFKIPQDFNDRSWWKSTIDNSIK